MGLEANAWELDLGDDLRAAVGLYELVHLIDAPVIQPVPVVPRYCRGVSLWQGLVLPVIDLAAWLGGHRPRGRAELLGVLVYRASPEEEAQFGALALADKPKRLAVGDEHMCELPGETPLWRQLAISCFRHGRVAVPILDTPTVFAKAA